MWAQLLSRVPSIGERLGLPGVKKGTVESVMWVEDGRGMVTLTAVVVPPDYLDALRAAGWNVSTREDPDDWLATILKD